MARYNILELDNALNFRDLGGYSSSLGGEVKKGKLFRSDSLANLSKSDIDIILSKEIRTVIDLRTDFEIAKGQSKLKDIEGVNYFKISLMDNIHSSDFVSFRKAMPTSMIELYVNLLNNSAEKIVAVFDTILKKSNSGIVFNCSAGKDRTGVIAALISDLLGVSKRDIYESYVITEKLMEPITNETLRHYEESTGFVMPKYLFESKQESIEQFIEYLYKKFGGAKNYLLENGFGEVKLNQFIDTYLQK